MQLIANKSIYPMFGTCFENLVLCTSAALTRPAQKALTSSLLMLPVVNNITSLPLVFKPTTNCKLPDSSGTTATFKRSSYLKQPIMFFARTMGTNVDIFCVCFLCPIEVQILYIYRGCRWVVLFIDGANYDK
jgi:hypothetical protein